MAKVEQWANSRGVTYWAFHCPGCGIDHCVSVGGKNSVGAEWSFNGDPDAPTFSPSINVFASDDARRCHSFVVGGDIKFLGDSFHALKGQTVPLPEWRE